MGIETEQPPQNLREGDNMTLAQATEAARKAGKAHRLQKAKHESSEVTSTKLHNRYYDATEKALDMLRAEIDKEN